MKKKIPRTPAKKKVKSKSKIQKIVERLKAEGVPKRPRNWHNVDMSNNALTRGLGTGKGKPRAIETPEKLWELFEEYKVWSKENPYKVHTHTNMRGVKQYQDKERVLTYIGFEGWLCMNEIVYDLTHYETAISPNTKDHKAVDYRTTIVKIKRVCSLDTITGASAGVYNANIASRLEGLSEKSEVKVEDNRKEVADLFPLDNDTRDKE